MKGLTGYLSTLAALLFAVAVWVGHSSPQPDTELSSPIARSSYAFDFGQAQSVLCFSRPDETRQSDLKRIIYRLFETGGVAADNAGFKQLHVPVRVFTPERAEENAVSKLSMPQPPQGADPNLLYVFGLGETSFNSDRIFLRSVRFSGGRRGLFKPLVWFTCNKIN